MEPGAEFDILEMPFEGLAAYWLSIKKLLGGRKGRAVLTEERASTSEPYIKYLLETIFSKFPPETAAKLAAVRKETLIGEYEKKLWLMRSAVLSLAVGENPRLTFVTMMSRYAVPPLSERQAFELAVSVGDGVRDPAADLAVLLGVDHKLKHEQLMVKLLFFLLLARREGKEAVRPYLKYFNSAFFKEGMALILDGFDPAFLETTLDRLQTTHLDEARRKMDMAADLAMAIRDKLSYDDVFAVARAYLP